MTYTKIMRYTTIAQEDCMLGGTTLDQCGGCAASKSATAPHSRDVPGKPDCAAFQYKGEQSGVSQSLSAICAQYITRPSSVQSVRVKNGVCHVRSRAADPASGWVPVPDRDPTSEAACNSDAEPRLCSCCRKQGGVIMSNKCLKYIKEQQACIDQLRSEHFDDESC